MLSSVHLKAKYLKTLGLVEPIQYRLGFRQIKKPTFHYIPLLDNLQTFIKKNNDVLDFVMNANQSMKSSINLPSSIAKKHQQLQCYYNYTSSRTIGKKDKLTNPKLLERNIDILSYENFIDKYPFSVCLYNNSSVVIPKHLIFNQSE